MRRTAVPVDPNANVKRRKNVTTAGNSTKVRDTYIRKSTEATKFKELPPYPSSRITSMSKQGTVMGAPGRIPINSRGSMGTSASLNSQGGRHVTFCDSASGKSEDESTNFTAKRQDSFETVPPSRVVIACGVGDEVTENELRQAVECFGTINYVMTVPTKKMALIEFEDTESATQLVTYVKAETLCVAGRPTKFNFSTSQAIRRPVAVEDHPNNVILMTIMNPRHPITVHIINTVCSAHGNVLRIVIFRKNGVQAMVEFDSLEGALKAKLALHGADIYSNCCTIRAEYAKPKTLTVFRNDSDSWDYTANASRGMKKQALLPDPSMVPIPLGRGNRPMGMQGNGTDDVIMGGHEDKPMEHSVPSSQGGPLLGGYDYNLAGGLTQESPDCVLMVYGINVEKMNCQRLFNLFCLYGNVLRVRFLKSKEGSAMVQMSDRQGCERVLQLVSNVELYGNKIQICYSKQTYMQEFGNPHHLPDGTLSYENYTGSKNNRYSGLDAANKNRAQPPSAVQYFCNAPPNVQESVLLKAFTEANVNGPEKVTLFLTHLGKTSHGVLHFTDVKSSTEALVCANNSKLPNPNGRAPYVLKLCF